MLLKRRRGDRRKSFGVKKSLDIGSNRRRSVSRESLSVRFEGSRMSRSVIRREKS